MDREWTGEQNGNENESKERMGGLKDTRYQGLTAWLMLLIGFLYIHWTVMTRFGLGVVMFTLVFCGTALYYMGQNGLKQTKTSLFYLAVTLVSAIKFAVLDDSVTEVMNFLFLQGMAAYWICVTAGRRINGDLSAYVIGDFFNQLVLAPFGNFGREFAALFQSVRGGVKKGLSSEKREEKKGRRRSLLLGAAGFLMILPVLILVVSLLSDADAAFADLIGRLNFSFHFTLPDNLMIYIAEFIFGIPVACYLFGLINGNLTGRRMMGITRQSFDRTTLALRVLPGITVYTAAGALIAVYVLFFATQAAYLFSAFRDSLPVTMTYAEYARRGFFELCTIAGINLAVIAAANLFSEQKSADQGETAAPPKALRWETAALCVLTMMLIAAAVSKMGMYIHYYGLTQLRFYTTAFMALMFLCFAVILSRQIRVFHCGRWLALIGMVGFLAVTCSNADGIIARYNISRYEAGTLDSLDVRALKDLSDAAVAPMLELYGRTEDPEMRRELFLAAQSVRYRNRYFESGERDFRRWNYQRAQADRMLSEMKWGEEMERWFRDYSQTEEFLYEWVY